MNEKIKERLKQIRRGELPDGYRRTKAGIIPSEWESGTLQTLCDINPKRNGDTSNKVTFIGMSDTDEDGRMICQHIVPYDTVCRGYTPFLRGDILVAKITPCFENGKGAYTENLETESGFGSTEFHVLRCRPFISEKYLFFHTQSGKFRKELQTEMTGSAGQKRVQTASISSYCVAVPPLAEQKRIADILSAQDSVIELKERLVTEKQRQKKYLMQRLFEKFHGEKRKIKDICKILGGGTPDTRKTEYWNGEILWCTPSDFSKSGTKYIDGTEKRISQLGLKSSSATMLPVGAVLLCTRATVGEARIASRPICTNQGFQSMIANPGISNEWLYYLVQYIKSDIIKLASGSTFLEISKSNLSNIVISVPALEFQLKIAGVLSAADREIELLRASLEQEKRKKKALSQLLLTGIVRV